MQNNNNAVAINSNPEIINFYNDTITAVKDTDGEIWATMNDMLKNIGFTDQKIQDTRRSLTKDIVISKWVKIFKLATAGGNRDTSCINRRAIPLALAKISITPTMQRTQSALVENLIRYQEECADVLYKHFYPREISKDTSLPLTREEMAVYMAALQSYTEETKKVCIGTFSAIKQAMDQQTNNITNCLSIMTDTASKFYSAYSANTDRFLEFIKNNKSSAENDARESAEENFIKTANKLLAKVCKTYKVDMKMAYTIIYGKMVEVDGINPYKYKTESSVIKSIAKNEECRKSFIKCVNIICGESNEDDNEDEDDNEVNKVNEISTSVVTEAPVDQNTVWATPDEIRQLITIYQQKTGKKTYQYASQCLIIQLCKKLGISNKQLRQMSAEYAASLGYKLCSLTYYIFNNKDLYELVKSIVEEA